MYTGNPRDFKIYTPAPAGSLQPVTDPRDVKITAPPPGGTLNIPGIKPGVNTGSGGSVVTVPSNAATQEGGGVDGQTLLIAGIAAVLLYKFVL
jgi:hypothetical protein